MATRKSTDSASYLKITKVGHPKRGAGWFAPPSWLSAALFVLVFGGLGTYFLWPSSADKPTLVDQAAPDHLLVSFRPGVSAAKQSQTLGRYGLTTQSEVSQISTKVVPVNPKALDAVMQALSHNPTVQFAEKDYLVAPQTTTPNDPYFPTGAGALSGGEWGSARTQAPAAWDVTTGSSAVTIAIVDSGIVPTQPDLAPLLTPGWNVLTNTTDTTDTYGHGTEVAGVAAAATNNATGVAGYCWSCRLMPVKVYGSASAYDSDIAKGITWAADNGARVINVSMAGTSSSTMSSAVSYAVSRGAVVVAAAGNNSSNSPYYPAASPGAIGVAGTDQTDTFFSYSNYGPWVTLAAPASTPTTLPSGAYGAVGGTSVASPAVAGIVGLLLSAKPTATPADVTNALISTTDATAGTKSAAHGRVNAFKALQAITGTTVLADTTPPAVNIASPTNGSVVAGGVSVNVSATDNVGVTKVELYKNGSLYSASTAAPYGFYWDTSTVVNGSYTLTAKAYDAAGNVTTSSATTITVANNNDVTAPTASISSPASGATVTGVTTVAANASDNVGVVSTELYIDGLLRASSTTNSVTLAWDTTQETSGAHSLVVKAYDAVGNIGTSAVTTVTVNNQPPTSDTISPVIGITKPAQGSSMTGVVAVSSSATDNVGVVKMELLFDGKLQTTSTTGTVAANWNTKKLKSGTHTITVNAYDAAGNKGMFTEQVVK